jgi:hypothetical protein
MPQKTTRKKHTATPETENPMASALNGAMVANMAQYGEACAKSFTAWQQEAIRFLTERLHKNSEAARAFSQCHNWEDMVALQKEWAQAASEDYAEEARRLSAMTSELNQSMLEPLANTFAAMKNGGGEQEQQ